MLTIVSIIQSRHDLEVSPTAFLHPNMQLVFKKNVRKAMQSQVQRGQKHTGKACSSSTGVKVLLKVAPSFFLPGQTRRVQTTRFQNVLASPSLSVAPPGQTCWIWASTRFTKELIYDRIRRPNVKKAPNICPFPSSHQSRLTVLARDGALRQARPNVLRRLAAVQIKLR